MCTTAKIDKYIPQLLVQTHMFASRFTAIPASPSPQVISEPEEEPKKTGLMTERRLHAIHTKEQTRKPSVWPKTS